MAKTALHQFSIERLGGSSRITFDHRVPQSVLHYSNLTRESGKTLVLRVLSSVLGGNFLHKPSYYEYEYSTCASIRAIPAARRSAGARPPRARPPAVGRRRWQASSLSLMNCDGD